MKYFGLFILLLLSKFSIFGQCDNSIIGEWKVISCFNGEVYFNLKNDSTFLTAEIKQQYPDTLTQRKYIEMAKDIYGRFIYRFNKDGQFTHTADSLFNYTGFNYTGKYCFIASKNVLRETSKNSLGKDVTQDVKAKLEHGILFLEQVWQDTGTMYQLTLERIK